MRIGGMQKVTLLDYPGKVACTVFLSECNLRWQSAAALVRKIAENYELPYYTISPTYSVCADHGHLAGEQFTCPICGKKTEVYSRITGYCRPVQNWNDGKRQEYKDRKTYQIGGAAQRLFSPHVENHVEKVEEEPADFTEAARYTLFVTATCPNCRAVKPLLQKAGIPFTEKDAVQYAEEAKGLGLRQAPTLVVQGKTPVLYVGASQIKSFLKEYAR